MKPWSYSINDDEYYGSESEEDAHESAKEKLEDESEPGEYSYWIAETENPVDRMTNRSLSIGEYVLEHIEEMCFDEVPADDEILTMTNDAKSDLGNLILSFIKSHANIKYFCIKKPNQFKHEVCE